MCCGTRQRTFVLDGEKFVFVFSLFHLAFLALNLLSHFAFHCELDVLVVPVGKTCRYAAPSDMPLSAIPAVSLFVSLPRLNLVKAFVCLSLSLYFLHVNL